MHLHSTSPHAYREGGLGPCTRRAPHGTRMLVHRSPLVPHAARPSSSSNSNTVDKGFSLLEWTNKLLPQSQLVAGVKTGWRLAWQTMVKELAPQSKDGAYKRPSYKFTGRIGDSQFPVESGRYHLYVGNACPWCHRVLLAAVLRGLLRPADYTSSFPSTSNKNNTASNPSSQHGTTSLPGTYPHGSSSSYSSSGTSSGTKPSTSSHRNSSSRGTPSGAANTHISFTTLVDDPTRARRGGWVFDAAQGSVDPVWGAADLWQVYDTASPGFRGRCTAPLLVDRVSRQIVSNESADIVRMLNDMQLPGCTDVDLYPARLRPNIDALNDKIYDSVNNGVYRAGFATGQAAYDTVQSELYSTLDVLDACLGDQRFLVGNKLTEADLRLFPTIVRFDAVYANIFKCSRRRVAEYPNLSNWMRDIWQLQVPGSTLQVRDTIDIDAARASYYTNLFPLNPSGIIPSGPTAADLKLDAPHNRGSSARLEDVCHVRPA